MTVQIMYVRYTFSSRSASAPCDMVVSQFEKSVAKRRFEAEIADGAADNVEARPAGELKSASALVINPATGALQCSVEFRGIAIEALRREARRLQFLALCRYLRLQIDQFLLKMLRVAFVVRNHLLRP